MLFQRKPPTPLEHALRLIHEASEIVMNRKRNKNFLPADKELELLGQIEEAFHHGNALTGYVSLEEYLAELQKFDISIYEG